MQEYQTQVREITYLTSNTLELAVDLRSPDALQFTAGQFMQFKIGEHFRSYSITSVPDHNQSLKFCIKLLPKGVGSDFVRELKVGDIVTMRGPSGIFTFTHFDRDAFLVATGVGVAPFASMIPDMLSRGFTGFVKLLFGVRHEEDVFYFDRFSHLSAVYSNFKFIPTLSQPRSHWPGEVGRVTTFLDIHYPSHEQYLFYLCGGMDMIKDARHILQQKKHPVRDIKLEIFV